ncbi:hypothetical protein IU443_28090 [Nocardia farcinica]|uniref:Uncharacterized protein n=1 Tax=Nocardia farcinica TaxID=37329 RepID=A0A449HDX1_NOCFR|nr:hypothetical protein [Nocardia farcinica]MBF6393792.1 hypothetical protein [Nocardia farcinica]MBF6411252.1 hypothetical protein [Nocardia farcinica]MCZ9330283.1 hypothetical protein [Nocardia farcinica]UEX26205.1 hypothetical protein LMJ57_30100 [Nocardia farcinica]VFA96229.1 Uncharacterised protein [Nocardia farcinica]
MTTTVLADQLPAEVTDPLLKLGGQLITLAGYFALGALFIAGIVAIARYQRGAGFVHFWRELLVICIAAAIAAMTFDIANWVS